jgi:hypothetical protein
MSGFGDLVFDGSRAVSDDEDDEFAQIQHASLKRKIHWLNDAENEKISADELILADGRNSSAFVYTYLISHIKKDDLQILASTEVSNKPVDQEPSLRSNYIYLINTNGKKLIVCQIYDQLKSNELYDWINQLVVRIEFKSSLIFCSQNTTSYLGSEEKTPFMRFISSSESKSQVSSSCVSLEEPNFIGDLPAALIHYCVSKQLKFTSFVCYTPSLRPDIQAIKAMYNAARNKLQATNPFINDQVSEKSLLSVERIVSSVSALYM